MCNHNLDGEDPKNKPEDFGVWKKIALTIGKAVVWILWQWLEN